MPNDDWEQHEADVQKLLGLDSTIASGSQWHDPGDGTTRNQYDSNPFRIMMDAKCTVSKSFSMKRDFLAVWMNKAEMLGKRFILPIRFVRKPGVHEDYVLLELNDFAELLMLAQKGAER